MISDIPNRSQTRINPPPDPGPWATNQYNQPSSDPNTANNLPRGIQSRAIDPGGTWISGRLYDQYNQPSSNLNMMSNTPTSIPTRITRGPWRANQYSQPQNRNQTFQIPPNQEQPFRPECNATNGNEPQYTYKKPWLEWENWTCACGENNFKNRGVCQKCRQPSPTQPHNCRICRQCDRRVFYSNPACYYCKSSMETPAPPPATNTAEQPGGP